LGGYHIRDIEFTLGIDVNATKVGKDLCEAISAEPNNTYKFADVPHLDVPVVRGMTHDGLGKYLSGMIKKAPGPTADIVKLLRDSKTDVVVNFLPVGSEMATKWYVEQCIEAGCAFVNGIPVFIASSEYWAKRFRDAKLPVLGDDIKSQVGATIVHRALATLFVDRGVRIDRTYQLNFGGNTDFLNMLERERLESKKISKTNAVTSMIPYELDHNDVHVGPSDHVPWLTDRKWAYIRMEGTTFGDVPLNVEVKLEVWDSPNSAGVMIDAVRWVNFVVPQESETLAAALRHIRPLYMVKGTDWQKRGLPKEELAAMEEIGASMVWVQVSPVSSSELLRTAFWRFADEWAGRA